jgi:exo-1,4-beta-D-glucosaminidase
MLEFLKNSTLVLIPIIIGLLLSCSRVKSANIFLKNLDKGWYLQSSEKAQAGGEVISRADFDIQTWYPIEVPATVMAGLVKNGLYPDLYFDQNLEKVDKQQFKKSWWYRKEFMLDNNSPDHLQLIFEGINYRANIWLNGEKIASSDTLYGAFRIFELDITDWITPAHNILAVEVLPPQPGDFTIGFVDWNPRPPDENMGLWREVKLKGSGPVAIKHPFVQSKVDLNTLEEAALTVSAELVNHSGQTVEGVLTTSIETITLSKKFSLNPYEKKSVVLNPENYRDLTLKNPRLWWPNNYGSPELYQVQLSVTTEGNLSDKETVQFGIREVADYINEQGHRGYTINGKKILIRGGGWVDDLLLTNNKEKLEAQFQYVKHMNLNTVRLEGFWGNGQSLYNLADEYGILLMTGFSCHWEWKGYLGKETDEFGGIKSDQDMALVEHYFRDHLLWLRNHPSIFVWVVGSDMLPRPALENRYRAALGQLDPTRPYLSTCGSRVSEVSGPSAVKMNGPYDYVPPVYWYTDTKNGGAFGFNTETGPGPQPPPVESIKRMIPEDHLWPIDETWNYHCARNEFNTMKRYLEALNQRYGPPSDLDNFALKAQTASYEAMRAMFEAFAVNKYKATGIIQWMLNSAWPETYWQLYDYFLVANGAFYGARTAGQPLNLVYHYGTKHIYSVSDTLDSFNNLKAEIRLFNNQSVELYKKDLTVDIEAGSVKDIADLSQIEIPGALYFLDLKLKDKQGDLMGHNFYWLSKAQDVLDYSRHKWFVTPIKTYADMTELNRLPQTSVAVNHVIQTQGTQTVATVKLENSSDKIAFFIELRLEKGQSGQSVVPIFWDDNYISLLPHETKTISARFSTADLQSEKPVLRVNGWNINKH